MLKDHIRCGDTAQTKLHCTWACFPPSLQLSGHPTSGLEVSPSTSVSPSTTSVQNYFYYFLLCYGRKPHTLKRSKQSLGPRAAAVCLLCRWGCGFLSGDNNREGDVNPPWSKGRAALHPVPRYSALARLWFPRNPEVPNAALLVQFLLR